MRIFLCDANGGNNQINKKRTTKGNRRLALCALTLLLKKMIQLKALRVTKRDTPKMVKISASTNKLSRFFKEHALHNMLYIYPRRQMLLLPWLWNYKSHSRFRKSFDPITFLILYTILPC